jgi:hypothetical protein
MIRSSPSFASLVDAFDIFTDCFVYCSIAYLIIITAIELVLALLSIVDEHQLSKKSSDSDFYDQVKELLNPSESDVFTTMTIRELRDYIRENQLHDRIYNHLGKSVSKACKHELLAALQ